MTTPSLPTLFVPHGAGPCFFMDWEPAETWSRLRSWLCALPERLGARPEALLVVSAHWEAPAFTVNAQAAPPLWYDYTGFPPHTYQLEYPAAGAPEVATRVHEVIERAGFAAEADHARGLDHGVFIPLKMIYPRADVPIVQLSLRVGLDPAEHLAVGQALAPLRHEGVLILGSGMSFHNMRRFRFDDATLDPDSARFDAWLTDTVALPAPLRGQRLREWTAAPGARAAHPRAEHLLPLHVVAGAAGGEQGRRVFRDRVLGSLQSAFMFGGPDSRYDRAHGGNALDQRGGSE